MYENELRKELWLHYQKKFDSHIGESDDKVNINDITFAYFNNDW